MQGKVHSVPAQCDVCVEVTFVTVDVCVCVCELMGHCVLCKTEKKIFGKYV
jgi:hypothetical protein